MAKEKILCPTTFPTLNRSRMFHKPKGVKIKIKKKPMIATVSKHYHEMKRRMCNT
ncbi:hypothetical protein, unlikely [Trypanosoma brucei brucei TREU927]|uniref:Uncharacterized protein n=1 Tax=Trypanosoma brucei brucei (strain 927/4 GUTat10.1) TaxID=185431 RepID=Q38F10_TRYB2|nr:hypothetical protein, unlikely [Trypanosoma brucei brucei TREU927]EAN76610.1 hypothetical protein, unlikely [Trypanosoma brucei brucei TREU927]